MISACPTRRSSARGFTLVELLIAVTIGLLLTLVIAELFIGSRHTYGTTDALSRMQENKRYARESLSRTIQLAGYKSSPNKLSTGEFGVFGTGNLAIEGTDTDGTGSDTITVRFQGSDTDTTSGVPDNSVVDCKGNPVGAGTIVTNTFSIGPDQTNRNVRSLLCNTDPTGRAPPVTIVPNVDNMQILYGVDTDPAPGDATADTWVTAASATPNQIVAVRIALLFASPTLGVRSVPTSGTYTLLGTDVTAPVDSALRQVHTITIALRNRTP